MAGLVRLVPAIPDCGGTALCIGIAGTSVWPGDMADGCSGT
jgi:hypothetical protein